MSENKVTNDGKRKIRNDIILVAALLLVIATAALCMLIFRTEGDTVNVIVDGKDWGEYPLSENRTVEIKTSLGTNVLVIKDGTAYVSNASCPDGICSSHSPILYDGESIICLPNKVVIEISKTSHDSEIHPDIAA